MTTPEGRAKAQFEAKPLLQAMLASGLRLQIVRSLAHATQTTPAEIEALFELSQPVAITKLAPPRAKRTAPIGLERQMIRLLVAHPSLAAGVDQEALEAAARLAPDNADMLRQVIDACLALGEQANFAALSEQLRAFGPDFEPLVAEIAADTESAPEAARLELAGAIRQTKMQVLRAESDRLTRSASPTEETFARLREVMQRLEQLRREAEVENKPR